MNVLVVDVGGTNVKILATGQKEPRRSLGPTMTPKRMVAESKARRDWKYDAVSIGYPGRVVGDRAITGTRNLAHGWSVRLRGGVRAPREGHQRCGDASLGSYNAGRCFSRLGTGLGSTLMVRGTSCRWNRASPTEGDIEDFLGVRAPEAREEEWRKTSSCSWPIHVALLLDESSSRRKRQEAEGTARADVDWVIMRSRSWRVRMWEPKTSRKPPLPTTSSRQAKEAKRPRPDRS